MWLSILLTGVIALGQGRPDCDAARQRLHSDSAREKAWGAYVAAECGLGALGPDIVDQLVEAQPQQLARFTWDSEAFWMARAFLDSLIRLRTPVGAEALKSIARGFPAEAAMLMLQRPYDNQESLASLRAELTASAIWVAASNALASMRSRGFAATLLREAAIFHRIVVTEVGEGCCSGMIGSLMGGPLTLKMPHGFPPVHFYRLTAKAMPGDELLADGATPIHVRHVLLEPGIEGTMPGEPEGFCLQCLRIVYLSQLSGLPRGEIEVAIEPNTAVHPARLDFEISRALERQVADMNRLSKSLLKSGALEPSELPMTLRIDVKLEDRTHRSEPLLNVPPLTFILRP